MKLGMGYELCHLVLRTGSADNYRVSKKTRMHLHNFSKSHQLIPATLQHFGKSISEVEVEYVVICLKADTMDFAPTLSSVCCILYMRL
jgi:hypothetical protein